MAQIVAFVVGPGGSKVLAPDGWQYSSIATDGVAARLLMPATSLGAFGLDDAVRLQETIGIDPDLFQPLIIDVPEGYTGVGEITLTPLEFPGRPYTVALPGGTRRWAPDLVFDEGLPENLATSISTNREIAEFVRQILADTTRSAAASAGGGGGGPNGPPPDGPGGGDDGEASPLFPGKQAAIAEARSHLILALLDRLPATRKAELAEEIVLAETGLQRAIPKRTADKTVAQARWESEAAVRSKVAEGLDQSVEALKRWKTLSEHAVPLLIGSVIFSAAAIVYVLILINVGVISGYEAALVIFVLAVIAISPAALLLIERPLRGVDTFTPPGSH